jgi:hypothetical protein
LKKVGKKSIDIKLCVRRSKKINVHLLIFIVVSVNDTYKGWSKIVKQKRLGTKRHSKYSFLLIEHDDVLHVQVKLN